jgi:hypothetical protein
VTAAGPANREASSVARRASMISAPSPPSVGGDQVEVFAIGHRRTSTRIASKALSQLQW